MEPVIETVIDTTLLKIIISVTGFILVAFLGFLAWVFKELNAGVKEIRHHQDDTKVNIAEIKNELGNVKESIHREIDLLRDNLNQTVDRVNSNSDKIADVTKEVVGLVEWKNMVRKDPYKP